MCSFWTPTERGQFNISGTGQITMNTDEGRSIANILRDDYNIKNIVEIGTWNGLGSTLCILQGIQGKNVDFWSLECNREKHDAAIESLSDLIDQRVKLLWGSIVDISGITHSKYLSYFPILNSSVELKGWFDIDLENCAACPNVLNHLPETIDFLLLDGGEFTTIYEFETLFPRCVGYIALDDTMTDKCKDIRRRLLENRAWREIIFLEARNGFSIFKNTSY